MKLFEPPTQKVLLAVTAAWALLFLDWIGSRLLPAWLLFIGFTVCLYFFLSWSRTFINLGPWLQHVRTSKGLSPKIEAFLDFPKHAPTRQPIAFRWRATLLAIPLWQFLVFLTSFWARPLSEGLTQFGVLALFLVGLAWTVWYVEMKTRDHTIREESLLERSQDDSKPRNLRWAVRSFAGRLSRKDFLFGLLYVLLLSLVTITLLFFLARFFARIGMRRWVLACLFLIISNACIYLYGLFAICAKRWHDLDRSGFWALVPFYGFVLPALFKGDAEPNRYGERPTTSPWTEVDPLNLSARYYGRDKQKLKQSLLTASAYGLAFTFSVLLLASLSGCREIYEMPAGGGEVAQLQQVKVQKVIKKKFVINPFSAILFNPPPIEEVQLQLDEATKHAYTVGYGKGTGAGFSGGTNRGAVRFIRLEYNGGDWDQDFGIGADLNILIEYNVRTRHKVAKKTESRKISQLANFPKGKSPPMVYMTGQKNISVSKKERDILRTFLTDKHGMIFADNGGSRHWHGQFFNLMKGVLPDVKPVKIPLDHQVHTVPYQIPFLPYVAPHGGKDAYGWVVDGRLAAYYHPGDIGDAWSDGHAGVKQEVWELCYQLGVNVIFYAHAEYNRWLDGQKEDE